MIMVVMVGGPLHGRALNMPYFASTLPPYYLAVASVEPVEFTVEPPTLSGVYHQYQYLLRWYNGSGGPTHPWSLPQRQPAYVCMEDKAPKLQMPAEPNEEDRYYAHIAETLWREAFEATIPVCVVPGCKDKGRVVFTAAEEGRLAGRNWQRGDEIRLCHEHAHDVYLAQGTYGMRNLADWIKPDATWNALDAYDAGADLLYGAEVLDRTARMLRLGTRRDR